MRIEDDETLFEQWCLGDRQAAHQLAQRYYRYLRRYFDRRANANIDDLVQQTLLAVFDARLRFRGQSSFRAYLFGTARRQLFGHARRSKREAIGDFDTELLAGESAATDPVRRTRTTDSDCIGDAVNRIPEELRVVVWLVFWGGLTAQEIAAFTGVPLNTVYSRLRRAKLHLRREWEE